MSLVKQLVLAIGLIMAIAFAGSFAINLQHSRTQLEAQLQSHADDAASALALSLSPHLADPPMIELMVASMFDSGYFASIQITAAEDGRVLFERQRRSRQSPAPAWFVRLADLRPELGSALLMQGWQQFGQVQVVSDPHLAIESLWLAAKQTLLWLILCGAVSAAIGVLALRRRLRPLDAMAAQAEAASRLEYYQVEPLPKARELRQVAATLNLMSSRLKRLFTEESVRAEQFRRQAFEDALTALPNRLAFEQALAGALNDLQAPKGALLALRINNLDELNRQIGSIQVDERLHQLAAPLRALAEEYPEWLCCRPRGGEFVVIAPGARAPELENIADRLSALALTLDWPALPGSQPVALGIAGYAPGETREQVLDRLDQALACCVENGTLEAAIIEPATGLDTLSETSPEQWQSWLTDACRQRSFHVHFQPAKRLDGRTILHHKLLTRLSLGDDQLIPAGEFLPRLERTGLGWQFDCCVVDLAFAQLDRHPAPIAISLTSQTLLERNARARLHSQLVSRPELCRWITLEADARRAVPTDDLAEFVLRLRKLGCGFALEHAGQDLGNLQTWATLGCTYLKVDSRYIRNVDHDLSHRLYLQALVSMAGQLELELVAEQVQTEAELAVLAQLGFHAAQGNAVAVPAPWPATSIA